MKLRKIHYVLTIGIALLLCSVSLFWSPYRDSGAPTWNGITPGETTLAQLILRMGFPDKVQRQDSCISFFYSGVFYSGDDISIEYIEGWGTIEVFLTARNGNIVVVSLLRSNPQLGPNFRSMADVTNLQQLVLEYGKPDKVTWSSSSTFRYLIWARKGVAATAAYMGRLGDWDDSVVVKILLFEPTDIQQLLVNDAEIHLGFMQNYPCVSLMDATMLPWNQPPPAPPDAGDMFPEDPYDWEHMPTPAP
ncbi:MAG: hypothetical protein FD146_1293 [Anaerolineaceae bacterium]|nr:MAG: hypothetical protein FD146_1293 [Anaerolineaceae bacterium]